MGLSGEELARVIDRLLLREPMTELDALPGPNTADMLFPLLAGDAVATQQFLLRAAHHPEVVFDRTADTASAFRLVLEATDRARMSVEMAGQIVPNFVNHFASTDLPATSSATAGLSDPTTAALSRRPDLAVDAPVLTAEPPVESPVWRRDEMVSFVLGNDGSTASVHRTGRSRAGRSHHIALLGAGPSARGARGLHGHDRRVRRERTGTGQDRTPVGAATCWPLSPGW